MKRTADEKRKDAETAVRMLGIYIPTGSTIYHVAVGLSDNNANGTVWRRQFMASHNGDVIGLNLYIHNLLGLRLDNHYNIFTRHTPQEVVTMLEQKLGYPLKRAAGI